MAARNSSEIQWLERQALKQELAAARQEIHLGTESLRSSVNIRARAKAFVVRRPGTVVISTIAAGALAFRLLPSLLWRRKGSLLARFTGELAKGAAGMALPFVLRRLTHPRASSPPLLSLQDRTPNHPTNQPNHQPNHTMTKLEFKGTWNQVKGNLKQKYAQLTDDDLLFEEGKEDELLGRLQKKTGEAKESIRDFIAKL